MSTQSGDTILFSPPNRNPLALADGTNLALPLGCVSEFFGPSYPFIVLGGFNVTDEGKFPIRSSYRTVC